MQTKIKPKRELLELLSPTPATVQDLARDIGISVDRVKQLARGCANGWGVRLLDNMVYVPQGAWKEYKRRLTE
jgi:hypothetical protein